MLGSKMAACVKQSALWIHHTGLSLFLAQTLHRFQKRLMNIGKLR